MKKFTEKKIKEMASKFDGEVAEMLLAFANVLGRIDQVKKTEKDFMKSKFSDVKGYTIGEVGKRTIEVLDYIIKMD